MIDALCRRWHIAPSLLLAEPADLVFALVAVVTEGAGITEEPEALTEDDMLRLDLIGRAESV